MNKYYYGIEFNNSEVDIYTVYFKSTKKVYAPHDIIQLAQDEGEFNEEDMGNLENITIAKPITEQLYTHYLAFIKDNCQMRMTMYDTIGTTILKKKGMDAFAQLLLILWEDKLRLDPCEMKYDRKHYCISLKTKSYIYEFEHVPFYKWDDRGQIDFEEVFKQYNKEVDI